MNITLIIISVVAAFIAGFNAAAYLSRRLCKHLASKGKYASAYWDEKRQSWIVRGHYLTIGSKIHQHLRKREDGKVKYKY